MIAEVREGAQDVGDTPKAEMEPPDEMSDVVDPAQIVPETPPPTVDAEMESVEQEPQKWPHWRCG